MLSFTLSDLVGDGDIFEHSELQRKRPQVGTTALTQSVVPSPAPNKLTVVPRLTRNKCQSHRNWFLWSMKLVIKTSTLSSYKPSVVPRGFPGHPSASVFISAAVSSFKSLYVYLSPLISLKTMSIQLSHSHTTLLAEHTFSLCFYLK